MIFEWFEFSRTGREFMVGGCWGSVNGTFFDIMWPCSRDSNGQTVFKSEVRPWREVIAMLRTGRIRQIKRKKAARHRTMKQLTLF